MANFMRPIIQRHLSKLVTVSPFRVCGVYLLFVLVFSPRYLAGICSGGKIMSVEGERLGFDEDFYKEE
jgi:hypothetical protein